MFDYIDGEAEDELTLARNCSSFREIEFRPRMLQGVAEVYLSVELLGRRLAIPIVLAPTGFTRIAHSEGELAVARAAARADIPCTLSSLSTRSIEQIRDVSDGDLWFQVYVWTDRGLVKEMLDRAKEAGYSAIVVTVDTALLGRRERDVRRGFTLPPSLMVGRAYLYGLGAAGEMGVDYAMNLLADGVRRTLALSGCQAARDVGPEMVRWRHRD